MKNWKNIMLVCVVFAGCKKAYNPSITITPAGYLVVEGVVNAGADSTIIQLSRTVGLSNKISSKAELNALVTVQDDQNISYPLLEIGGGKYASAGLNLSNGHKYRLSIKTSNTGQYFSDYMEV